MQGENIYKSFSHLQGRANEQPTREKVNYFSARTKGAAHKKTVINEMKKYFDKKETSKFAKTNFKRLIKNNPGRTVNGRKLPPPPEKFVNTLQCRLSS